MLFEAGSINRRGTVEEKNTVSDYHAIEHKRGNSIYSSLLHCEWRDNKINIIDTPGFDDFIGEVISALKVADTGIMVLNAPYGVEVGTEFTWDYTEKYNVPVIFAVNHLDSQKAEFEKTHDILDVWFDSGVSHQAVAKIRLSDHLPVDLYLEGSDQHRGWFQSSLIPAIALESKPPFKAVLTHGFVVDGDGRKMSKSMGNVISPQDIIKNSGADILRLWVASSLYNEDIRISKETLDRLSDAYRKIRNTIRYLLGNLSDFDPDTNILAFDDLLDIDRWALYRLKTVIAQVKQSYGAYEFAKVYKGIYTFCNEDLSSFYLDILKDRLYTSALNSQERRSAQTVLFHVLNHLVRAIAPIFCFTAEEIFLSMPKDASLRDTQSVHILPWIDCPEVWDNKEIREQFALLVALRPHVLKALEDKRRTGEIGNSLEAKIIFETASQRDSTYLIENADILPSAFIVSQVEVQKVDNVSQGLNDEFSKTAITIKKADGQKCSRCWNYKKDVGQEAEHQTLCQRCIAIVKELL